MSTLLLVRHGQARAYDADSDRLSELGEAQARRVGEFLVENDVVFDEVYSGTLVRQRRTAELVGKVFEECGRAWRPVREEDGWNEYDSGGVLGTLLPQLAEANPSFRKLVEAFQMAESSPDRNRHFQRMFEVLMDEWQRDRIGAATVESFTAFHGRVTDALGRLTSIQKGSRRVAVFTSGGPIGVCVQTTLEAPPKAALRLNWRVQNASLTEFIFSADRISLEQFNSVGHMPREMRSYR